MNDELHAWMQWKERCALERCETPVRNLLAEHGATTLIKVQAKYPDLLLTASGQPMDREYGFSLVEQYGISRTTVQSKQAELNGKSYKDGMFLAATLSNDPPLQVIHGRFHQMLRSVLRDRWQRERCNPKAVSVDDAREGRQPLLDRLTAPWHGFAELERRELREIAADLAPKVFEAMSRVDKVILLGRALDLPITNSKEFATAAGIGKSTIAEHAQAIFRNGRYLPVLREAYPSETDETLNALYRYVLGRCAELAISWGRPPENGCGILFTDTEAEEDFR